MRRLSVLLLLVLGAACQRSAPPRPLPASFRARGLDGASVTPETMRGRPWLVNPLLPVGGTCARELPELEKLARQYEGRVGFVAVSIAPDRNRIRVAAETMGLRTM